RKRIDDLEAEVEELRELIEEHDRVVDTDLDGKSYEQLTRTDKVREIRRALVEEAAGSATNKASMEYQDVRWLFNGRPSTGHVYDLMAVAAQESGFHYQEREDDSRLVVDLSGVPTSLKTGATDSRRE
ncbi:MAG: hypothetical protein ABEI98_06180, partial [Halorhabdus sp.]